MPDTLHISGLVGAVLVGLVTAFIAGFIGWARSTDKSIAVIVAGQKRIEEHLKSFDPAVLATRIDEHDRQLGALWDAHDKAVDRELEAAHATNGRTR